MDGTRGLGVGGLIRCAGRPREWSCGAVPPQERWHEGGFLVWGILLRLDWEPLRGHVLAAGAASHACRRGSGSTRGFNFFVLGDSFTRSGVDGTRGLGVGGLIRCAGRPREWSCGAVPPQERKESSPALFRTFGAATAVTENAGGEVFGLGDSWSISARGSPLAREIPDIFRAALFQDQGQPRGKFRNDDVVFFLGGCSGVGGMLTTGVVMRRRATTGVDGTREVGLIVFFLGVAPVSEGC